MNKDDIEPLEDLLDDVRDIDGFPIAEDEDILELSDPPYYTACPNPYINDFIEKYGTQYDSENDDYERKPFVGDVSEGKTNSVYMAHSYHTKVPHKAIMKFINHYTEEDDIIFDGFCGSGMTGIAAQMINRRAILSDLSPTASYLAYNYNKHVNISKFREEATKLLNKLEDECDWMYETGHELKNEYEQITIENLSKNKKGRINYTVWSDVFICPYCNNEYVFWNVAVDKDNKNIKDEYKCLHCGAEISKKESEIAKVTRYDNAIGEEIEIAKQVPVLINYSYNNNRYEKKPDKADLDLIKKIDELEIPYWFPRKKIPEGDKTGEPRRLGINYMHLLYTKRNLWVLSSAWDKCKTSLLKQCLLSILGRASKMYRWNGSRPTGTLTGTLYIGSLKYEFQLFDMLKRKINAAERALAEIENNKFIISTQNLGSYSNCPLNSIDYIFTDPPFGNNLMYSELNLLQESWLKIYTNNKKEAIVNNTQNKDLEDYTKLMTESFKEMYRVLKPNRWMTVVFHNSKAKVWNAIQESITRAGFIIAQVTTMDKNQSSFNQVTASGAVKNDLIINAYKPKKEFEEKFLKNAGEGMEVDFVSQQLEHLPIEANIERTEKMLYSKMLAHYVENGFKIKYNANNFYKLLHDNFVELDGYWFLEEQVDQYSEWKSSLKLDEIEDIKEGNQVLFVMDENSALTWLNSFLDEPKEYGEIYTNYEQVATKTNDEIPELRELLDNNFIMEDGKYRRPKNKQERAKVEKNREKNLEKAWQKLLDRAKNGRRKIKNVRKEAMKYGFTKCYQEENYEDIVTVADRLYKSTLEKSGDILDFVDIARMKLEG